MSGSSQVFRILNGNQQGVGAPLTLGRWLIGNDPNCCDLIVEPGSPGDYLLVLNLDESGATVKPVQGPLWIGDKAIDQPVAQRVRPLEPITLGRVSIAFGPENADFDQISLPATLLRPGQTASLASTPLVPKTHWAGKVTSVLGGTFVLLSVVMLIAAAIWWAGVVRGTSAQTNRSLTESMAHAREQISQAGFDEVSLKLDEQSSRFVATGYVKNDEQLDELTRVIGQVDLPTDVSVVRVEPLRRALAERLGRAGLPQAVRYAGDGSFSLAMLAREYRRLATLAESAFRDLSALRTLKVDVTDIQSPATLLPVMVSLERVPGSLGKIAISGDNLPMLGMTGSDRLFVEVRAGAVPSVVTRDGRRLFVGAVLPDGSQISHIDSRGVVIAKSGASRHIDVAGSGVIAAHHAYPPGRSDATITAQYSSQFASQPVSAETPRSERFP